MDQKVVPQDPGQTQAGPGRHVEGQGVEDVVATGSGGDLDQAETIRIPVESRRFAIEGEGGPAAELVGEGLRIVFSIDEDERHVGAGDRRRGACVSAHTRRETQETRCTAGDRRLFRQV